MGLDDEHSGDSGGVTAQDLPRIRRELLMDALAVARHDHDPAADWAAFCDAVWREVALAYGFVEREPWPEGLDIPRRPAGSVGENPVES